jgi:hypothetical protein
MGDIILVVSFLRLLLGCYLDSFFIILNEGVLGAVFSSSQVDLLDTLLVLSESLLIRTSLKKSLGSLHVLIFILLGREVALPLRSDDSSRSEFGFI